MTRNTFLEKITAIVFILFVGIILYYAFWPFKVTSLRSITIDKEEYCRGDWVEVTLDFTKNMDVPAKVTWYIVDGIVYQLETPGVNRQAGINHVTTDKQVPLSLLPGKYHLRVEMEYNVHPLHKLIVNTWDTPTFTVLPSDKCPNTPPIETQKWIPSSVSKTNSTVKPVASVSPTPVNNDPEKETQISPAMQITGTAVAVGEASAAPLKKLINKIKNLIQ